MLKIENLYKSFGENAIIQGVSFEINKNERVALIGPNGAGKSTMLNLITGILSPTSGSIRFEENDISSKRVDDRNRLGIARTLQHSSIFPSLSVFENILVAAQRTMSKLGSSKLPSSFAHEILEQVGLRDRANVEAASLSYGEKRLLEIGIAMATKPKLLLMDEPMAGLDHIDIEAIIKLVHKRSELPIILVEHNMDVVFEIADRIIVLNQGKVLADGKPDVIRSNKHVQEVYLGQVNQNAQD